MSQRARKSTIPNDYKVYVSEEYVSEEFQMKGEPTSFEEAMRSDHSQKWLEAMEDEIRSMSTMMFGTQKKFLKESKQQAVNGSTKPKMTPKGMWKDLKRDL